MPQARDAQTSNLLIIIVYVFAANVSKHGLHDRRGVQWHRCTSIYLQRAGAVIIMRELFMPADWRVAQQIEVLRRLPVWRRWRGPPISPGRLYAPTHINPH